jgi:hypothetical protein
MSEGNVIDFPHPHATAAQVSGAPKWTGYLPRWHCEIHGDHDQVVCIATVEGLKRTYCIPCIVDLFDGIGLRNLPQVSR